MDALEALYQQFDPARPLDANEVDLYVDWQSGLGPVDVKKLLANSIARSGDVPVTRLFTGHRGVGKTTELKRVQRMLSDTGGSRKMFVSFFEAERWMDLQDVQPPDIIYSILRQLVADLDAVGFGFAKERFTQFVQEIKDLLAREIEFKDFKIKTNHLDIGMVLKEVPAARSKLRMLLQARIPNIFELINTVILREARSWLRKHENGTYEDIVLIVDELDRIPQRILNPQGLTNHENIFLDNAGVLRSLQCDVLYTIPIELAYSRSRQRLRAIYGSEILTLPVIPVSTRSGEVDNRGLAAVEDIVKRRALRAQVTLETLFEERHTFDSLCRASGGHVRNLFILLRSAIDYTDALPLTDEVVRLSLRQEAESITLPLGKSEWEVLRTVHATKRPPDDVGTVWYGLLRDLFVFAYSGSNGMWYDWNPLLGEVEGL